MRLYAVSMTTKPKRPRDPNQLAHLIAAIATGEVEDANPDVGKDPAAVALGRKGGLKGGKARAAKLTPEKWSAIAKKAAKARWSSAQRVDDSVSPPGKAKKVRTKIQAPEA